MSKIQTQWKYVPSFQFPLKGLLNPTQIMEIVKKYGIKKYTYEIRCKNITIKYGMSDAETTQDGERIYRQIGHLDSWGGRKLIGGNGEEFLKYNQEYIKKYSENMNHNDMVITIWNFDNYPFSTINSSYEIELAEIELIETYAKLHNEKPIGNIDDGYKFHKKSAPIKSVYEVMFNEY